MTAPSWLRHVAAELPGAARTGLAITGFVVGLFLGGCIRLELLS